MFIWFKTKQLMIHWREEWQKHQFVIPKSFMESDGNRVYRVLQGTGYYNVLQSTGLYWGILGGGGYRNQTEFFIFNKNIYVESEALLSIF